MDRYAVIGSPVSHSLSPRIHKMFAEQTGQTIEYSAIEVKPENFFHQVNHFADQGYRGLNITLPLKSLAWEMADCCGPTADRAKAVNTIRFERDGQRNGFNTDGIGLLKDLTTNHAIDIQGRKILILGAGGGVRGVLAPLLYEKPDSIVIANRTAAKAQQLAQEFCDLGAVQGGGYDLLDNHAFDLIINGTSASLAGEIPPLSENILSADAIVYDMLYSSKPTIFMDWCAKRGAIKCFDGLGMLVEQAAEAFSLWRAVRPETQAVMAAMRSVLNQKK